VKHNVKIEAVESQHAEVKTVSRRRVEPNWKFFPACEILHLAYINVNMVVISH
jgi:hypothetical protein